MQFSVSFLKDFHIRKLGKVTVFYAMTSIRTNTFTVIKKYRKICFFLSIRDFNFYLFLCLVLVSSALVLNGLCADHLQKML